jgi:hypothetical protein
MRLYLTDLLHSTSILSAGQCDPLLWSEIATCSLTKLKRPDFSRVFNSVVDVTMETESVSVVVRKACGFNDFAVMRSCGFYGAAGPN